MRKLSTSQESKVREALAQHDRHKNCYFWNGGSTASERRRNEQRNNWSVKFKHLGHTYEYTSNVACSCEHYYYSGTFLVDGVKKTRRAFASLVQ